jgi:dihydrolipoamide dehydrogenase
MNEMNVDVAVIGAGTAGLAAYRAAIAATAGGRHHRGRPLRHDLRPRRLHAEQAADRRGGSGARNRKVGRLRHPSRWVGAHRRPAVMDARARERDRFVGFVLRGVDNIPAEHKLRGYAKFLDDRSLQVDDHTVVTFGVQSSPPARRRRCRRC